MNKVIYDEKSIEKFLEKIKNSTVEIYSLDSLRKKLLSGKKLIIKLGADPSRPDLHLGHTVVLNKLKLFQELGHEVVFIIGDFTAMIGDPTGKSKTRPSLTYEQAHASGATYFKQVTKILDPAKTRIVYNSEWLKGLKFEEVLVLMSKYTVARILERDDFSKRFKSSTPISLHEFMYPLLQGYDSVALEADIEIGGTDQTFNMLVGRELQKDYGKEVGQDVITFPLLVGLDGKEKMSKSLDNYIGIDESPFVMYEKCMKVPDSVLEDYFVLTTNIEKDSYLELLNKDIINAHRVYAKTIVTMYHGEKEAIEAEVRYNQVASKAIPTEIKTIKLSDDGNLNITNRSLIELLVLAGFAVSNSQARQLILGKGVKVDGEIIDDFKKNITVTQSGVIISKGKANFIKFVI